MIQDLSHLSDRIDFGKFGNFSRVIKISLESQSIGSSKFFFQAGSKLSSIKVTYPTRGKGKTSSTQKMPAGRGE